MQLKWHKIGITTQKGKNGIKIQEKQHEVHDSKDVHTYQASTHFNWQDKHEYKNLCPVKLFHPKLVTLNSFNHPITLRKVCKYDKGCYRTSSMKNKPLQPSELIAAGSAPLRAMTMMKSWKFA